LRDSLEAVLLATARDPDASPGAVIAIQIFGDFLNFNGLYVDPVGPADLAA
jgi:hypothetical protein